MTWVHYLLYKRPWSQLHSILVAAQRIFSYSMGDLIPWESGVLATRPPVKSLHCGSLTEAFKSLHTATMTARDTSSTIGYPG